MHVNERVLHRVGDELLAEGCIFRGHPVIHHDRRGIDLVHFPDNRRPVLHRELDVGDAGDFELAALLDGLLRSLRDGLAIADLLLDDMNLAVLGLPDAHLFFVLQPDRIGPAVVHFRRIGLEDVTVFFRIGLESVGGGALRVALKIRTFVPGRRVHGRNGHEQERIRNRVHLGVDTSRDRLFAALRGELVDVGDEQLELAPKNAAGSVDLFHRQRAAVEVIADRRRRRRRRSATSAGRARSAPLRARLPAK